MSRPPAASNRRWPTTGSWTARPAGAMRKESRSTGSVVTTSTAGEGQTCSQGSANRTYASSASLFPLTRRPDRCSTTVPCTAASWFRLRRSTPTRWSANNDSAVPQDGERPEHEGNRHRPQSREPDVVACRSVDEEVADGVDHGGKRVVLCDRLKPAGH